jgi:hypothetical protein
MKMNIFALKGHKIKFTNPKAGYPLDQKMGLEHLEIGKEYTVEYTEVSDYSASVILQEIPKIKFNSVLFSDVVEKHISSAFMEPINKGMYKRFTISVKDLREP